MQEVDESEVEQGNAKGTTEITDLTFDCLEKVFNFVPLKDELTCVEVWPEWRGNVLLSLKQLKITRNNQVKCVDDLSEEMVFGEKGYGFREILNHMYNLEVLDVGCVNYEYQQQIVEDIGTEKRRLRVIKLGICERVNYGVFRSMVDAVPLLEEFRAEFGYSKNTDDNVSYLLTRAEHLHTVDLDGSFRLRSDGFRGVCAKLKVVRVNRSGSLSPEKVIDHILELSRYTLEELRLALPDDIPYNSLKTVSKFKNLKVVSCVVGPRKCLQPINSPTEVFHLSNLQHLDEINIRGCFHDEDIRSISGSWKHIRDLKLIHYGLEDASHQPSYDALLCVRYMTSIMRMELWGMKNLNDDHIQVFSRELAKLKHLRVLATSVTSKGLKYLANLPDIEEIMCDIGVGETFANNEVKGVIRVLNAAQAEKGREFRIVQAGHSELHLRVKILD